MLHEVAEKLKAKKTDKKKKIKPISGTLLQADIRKNSLVTFFNKDIKILPAPMKQQLRALLGRILYELKQEERDE